MLRELESRFAGELVVVGVHSAKFMAEKATENLREAVLRYGVEHPVVNDREFEVWNAYAVRAWPTLLFLDPAGRLVAKHEGEAPLAALERFCASALEEYRSEGLIDLSRPLPLAAEGPSSGLLAFPGKVAVSASGDRLAISDTNHDRVILASAAGEVESVFEGFTRPQGVCFDTDGGVLYVADTGAHSLRSVDLRSRSVTLLAGTGTAGMSAEDLAAGALRSPWDVAWSGGSLFVAMAGAHQVWRLRSGELRPFAGSGREGLQDGSLQEAWLAQPSGVAALDGRLYVADSEVSGVREVLLPEATVRTLVGTGLFDFGDRDGPGASALLQHPLGVSAGQGRLYVADSYNNKVKLVDLGSEAVSTLAGTGEAGFRDGPAAEALFNEPGGVAVSGSLLYVADTNNHRVRVVDLDAGAVRTLELSGL